MKRRKITCLSMALIITMLLTGCSAGDIPVVGKFLSKDSSQDTGQPADVDAADTGDTGVTSMPEIDAQYPAVPAGTTITVDDIFNMLSSVGLSTDTVSGYLILDANGMEANELYVTEDTYFTFIYQMRDADASEQSQMVIGVTVTDEVVSTPEEYVTDTETTGEEQLTAQEEVQEPAAAKYEVFDFSEAAESSFDYSELDNGKVYTNNVLNFDISKVLHSFEYESIAKSMVTMVAHYTDVDTEIANKFTVYCIPKSYVYMQALDYEDGSDLSAYNGEYVLVLVPIYDSYTDEIYRTEDTLILSLPDEVNEFATEPSDDAKQECDFYLSEEFDDETTEIDDFYGAEEILLQLESTEDLFIFDDVLKVKVVDYADMGTPDNMSDDITWEEYEAGLLSGESTSTESSESTEGESSEMQTGTVATTESSTTTITETTTTTTTESIIQAMGEDIQNSFYSRHPELFTFFPNNDQVFSKFDWRIGDETTIKGTITLKDGTVIPELDSRSGAGIIYDITDGSKTTLGGGTTSDGSGTGGVFGTSGGTTSSTETSSESGVGTLGDGEYETADPNESGTSSTTEEEEEEEEPEEYVGEYEIKLGSTKALVTSNNTYRYMIDLQNSSTSEVYINNKDNRYTIKVVDDQTYMQYWTKDHLNRSMNGYSITAGSYTGATDNGNNSIVMLNIQYTNNQGANVTEPYMAYIRNGSEYIICIPDKAEESGSDTLADILKRCVELK